jgi:signal transduction histidine kinase
VTLSARLLILVLLAVLPAVAIEIWDELDLRAARQQEIRDDAQRMLRLVAAEQDRIGEGARQLLIALSEAPMVRSRNWPQCSEAAARVRAQVKGYSNIGVVSADGVVLCSALAVPPNASFRMSPLLAVLRRDVDFAAGTFQISQITGSKVLSYAIPLKDDSGARIGLAWASLDLDWLADHFADRFTSPNLTLLMADRDGTILVRLPDQAKWVGKPIGAAYMGAVTATVDGVVETAGVDGELRVIAYTPAATTPSKIYVGVGLSTAPAFAEIDAATRRKAIIITIGFALTLLAAWLAGGIFVRKPIALLLDATRRWRGGDYGARVRLADRKSEIGRLGDAFDAMADALKRRDDERREAEEALARLNAELERRVDDEVTERERAQFALLQSQKIEAVGQLTSGVAHDFNNLLAAVLGNLELLRPRLGEERALRLVDGAARAAARGARLTEQLLAFSRHHHLEPQTFDLNRLIAEMSDLLTRTIGATVAIQRRLEPDLWPILADPSQIEVSLLNLALNARDAMPQGGTLWLETANIPAGDPRLPAELSGDPGGDFVRVSVADGGVGMSQEVRERAIEPFFTTKDVGKGTGLGLSMVYGVAKQSGGIATIDSAVGRGTTVAIFLPRATVAAAPPLPEAVRPDVPQNVATGRILVIDDDAGVREVTVGALLDAGYEPIETDSGKAGLDLLKRGEAVDLVIVDYAMPGLTGIEVARIIRESWPHLPIILVTGYTETGLAENLPAGVQIVKKPFRIADLLARIDAALHPRSFGLEHDQQIN